MVTPKFSWLVDDRPSDRRVVVTPKFSWLEVVNPSERWVVVIPKLVWLVDEMPVLLSRHVVIPKLV